MTCTRPHTPAPPCDPTLDQHEKICNPTKDTIPGPDLPVITSVENWAHLLHTHTHTDFATLANQYSNATCPPVTKSSSTALLTPGLFHQYAHGKWQGTMEVQDCLTGIFRLLEINPSITLLQQHEIDQMLCLGEAPHRWKLPRHFNLRASYEDPSGLPTCCGPCHHGHNPFVTFYLCPEYWTILAPLSTARDSQPDIEVKLHNALA